MKRILHRHKNNNKQKKIIINKTKTKIKIKTKIKGKTKRKKLRTCIRTIAFVKLKASGALLNPINIATFNKFNSLTLEPVILIIKSTSNRALRKSFLDTVK